MIDHTQLKPAAAVVLAGAAAAALTVGQSAFAASPASSRSHPGRAACTASRRASYRPPPSVSGAPVPPLACAAVTLAEVPGNVPMRAWKGLRRAWRPGRAPRRAPGLVTRSYLIRVR